MKLSVLIPIYNFQVTEFVSELHAQLMKSGTEFEILCIDDASELQYRSENKKIATLPNVFYSELPNNIGRSKIRNRLARNARFDYLLFFDCDSKIICENFIKKYLDEITPEAVLFGGRSYEMNLPCKENALRWHYGIHREYVPLENRRKNPYRYFMTNNFLIPKKIFLTIGMNENLNGYGHEDTLFANELRRMNVPIKQINNYLCHVGLESSREFLDKSKQGISNLAYMIRNNFANEDMKIYKYYRTLKKLYLLSLISVVYKIFERKLIGNLLSASPNLLFFDLVKLNWLIEEMKKIKHPV